jgi:hypothetical protein
VDKGADVNLLDKTSSSPLHYAALFAATPTGGEEREIARRSAAIKRAEETAIPMVELFLLRVRGFPIFPCFLLA